MAALLRAECPVCGRTMAVQPARGGDGSVDVFPRHRPPGGGSRCDQSRSEVRREHYRPAR